MFTFKKIFISFIISLLLVGTLALFNIAYADPPSGGDASDSMVSGTGTIISTGTFTADLGPGDTTDRYRIAVTAGQTLAVIVSSTDTANEFDYITLSLWYPPTPAPALTFYLFPGTSRTWFYTNVTSGSGYLVTGFFLTGTRCHYDFTVTLSVQNDAGTGGDVSGTRTNAPYIVDGDYNGYVDEAAIIDYYRFIAVENFNLTIDASTASGLAIRVILYEGTSNYDLRLVQATISSNSSAQLTYLTTKTSTAYFIKIQQMSGSGTYAFSLTSEANLSPGPGDNGGYLCVIPYPNPFDISKNHTKITFDGSGVPYGKIRIYTFDGKLIKTLEETSGNSSLDWYPLQDDIPSGSYLYGTDNPAEKNIGKITIIR